MDDSIYAFFNAQVWYRSISHHMNSELGPGREPSGAFFALVRLDGRVGLLVRREGRRVRELFVALPAHELLFVRMLEMQGSEI